MAQQFERRWYQKEALDATIQCLIDNPGCNPLIQMMTGAGKSVVIMDLVMTILTHWPKTQFMVLTHVRELVEQNWLEIKTYYPNAPVGVYCAGLKKKDVIHPVIFGSIASVAKAPKVFGKRQLVIVDECFSGDTEILTEHGFVRFDALLDQRVAQYNSHTQMVDFVQPLRKIRKLPNSKMLRVHSANLFDLVLTENHEMLLRKHDRIVKERAKDVCSTAYNRMFTAGFGSGTQVELNPFEKFVIMYQADGSAHRCNKDGTFIAAFSFSKERKIAEFKKLMVEGGFRFNEVKSSRNEKPNVVPRRRFMVYAPYPINKDVSVYFDISALSWTKAQAIISYMNKWDGNVASKHSFIYTTTNESCANFYQAVCALAGFRSKLTKVVDHRSDKFNDVYRLNIVTNSPEITTQSWEATPCDYEGEVFCVEVPTGNIIVRRGGKVLVTGNCHLISPEDDTMYQQTLNAMREACPELQVIGLTATGWRTKQGRLTGPGQMFDRVSYDLTKPEDYQRLINEGYLSKVIGADTDTRLSVEGVGRFNGDFAPSELSRAVNKEEITRAALREAMERGWSRNKAIIFGSGTDHVHSIHDLLHEEGIPSVFVHSHVPSSERKKRIQMFRDNKVGIIIGNKILSTGFNCRSIDLIVDLQPTDSVGYYIQKVGRGLRVSPETYKENCLYLDFAGNIPRNGPIDYPRIPTASGGAKGGDVPVKICENPQCRAYNFASARFCHACGHEFIFQVKITATPSTSNVLLGTEPVVETFSVDHVSYLPHSKEGSPPMIRVVYGCGGRQFQEFIGIEHKQHLVQDKAKRWWMQRHDTVPPVTTQAMLDMTHLLRKPVAITVVVNKKFPEILSYEF